MIIENTNRKRDSMAYLLLLVIFSCFGCNTKSHKTKSPSLSVPTQHGTIEFSGDASNAPEISEEKTETETIIPANSQVSFVAKTETEPESINVIVSKDTTIKTVNTIKNIKGPVSHTPPSPPSLNDIISANAVSKSFWVAGIMGILSALLFWRSHIKAGFIAAAAAICVVPVTKFIGAQYGMVLILIALAVSLSLFAAWHFMQDKTKTI